MSHFGVQLGLQNGVQIDGFWNSRANLCCNNRKCQNLYHSQAKTFFFHSPAPQKPSQIRQKIDLKSLLCCCLFLTPKTIPPGALPKPSCKILKDLGPPCWVHFSLKNQKDGGTEIDTFLFLLVFQHKTKK